MAAAEAGVATAAEAAVAEATAILLDRANNQGDTKGPRSDPEICRNR